MAEKKKTDAELLKEANLILNKNIRLHFKPVESERFASTNEQPSLVSSSKSKGK